MFTIGCGVVMYTMVNVKFRAECWKFAFTKRQMDHAFGILRCAKQPGKYWPACHGSISRRAVSVQTLAKTVTIQMQLLKWN